MKLNIRSCISNLKSNIMLILSSAALLGMFVTKEVQLIFCVLLLFIGIVLFASTHDNVPKLSKECFSNKIAVTLSVLFEIVAFTKFYYLMYFFLKQHIDSSYWLVLGIVVGAVALAMGLVAFYAVYTFSGYALKALQPFADIIKNNKKQFCVLLIIYAICIVPIIRADFYYVDDIARATEGYNLTGRFSRFLSSYLAVFIHANACLTDISPLTQIIAVAFLALAAIILWNVVTDGVELNWWGVIALVSLCASPYYLQCLSYKFDSPYMAFSVLISIAPLVYRKRNVVIYAASVAVSVILMCITYQASSGIFPITVALISLLMWSRREEIKKIGVFIASSVIGYLGGILFFRSVIMQRVDGGYVDTGVSPTSIIDNLSMFFKCVSTDFPTFWLFPIAVMLCAFVGLIVMTSRQNKVLTLFVASGMVAIMAVLSFGAYILMAEPMTEPRSLYGFCVFLTLIAIPLAAAPKKGYLGKAAVLLMTWVFIVFSFTYGNSLSVQAQYTDFRITSVVNDLKSLDVLEKEEQVIVQVSGTIGHAKNVEKMINHYYLLDRMVPVTFCDSSWIWGRYGLLNYYGLDNITVDTSIDLQEYDLPIIVDNCYHTIRGEDNYVLIELK